MASRPSSSSPDSRVGWVVTYRDAVLAPKGGELSARERAIVGVVVSAQNRCASSLIAQSATLRAIAQDRNLPELPVAGSSRTLAGRERALVRFATKVTREPCDVEESDLEALRREGLNELAIFERVELVATLNAIDRMTTALGIAPESPCTADEGELSSCVGG